MKTLYIIDAYAAFFRCYHAIRTPMTSPVTKEPTNMTFGFIGLLLKLLRGEGTNMVQAAGKPDYLAVALDVGGDRGTFRTQLYQPYKANRSEPPVDLRPQVERCLALLQEIGVPTIGVEGFEADDVIATMVENLKVSSPELNIRIVSKDKDLKQLLEGQRVQLFDVHTDTPFTQETLMTDLGITPDQVIDMLSLMGDTSDNVPGVDGVGEKTASAMIREYGSMEKVLANADQIKGKRGEKLREAIPHLGLSRQLITLRKDVPFTFDLEQAKIQSLRVEHLIPRLKELGFNRYQDEVKVLLGAGTGLSETSASSGSPASQANGVLPEQITGGLFQKSVSGDTSRQNQASATQAATQKKPTSQNTSSRGADPIFGGLFQSTVAKSETSTTPDGGASGRGEEPRLDKTGESSPPQWQGTLIKAEKGTYTCVNTPEQLTHLVEQLEKVSIFAIDTETTALSPHSALLCGISISFEEGKGYYIPVRSPQPHTHMDEKTVLDIMRKVLEDQNIPKCGHNLKFDINIFRAAGITLRGLCSADPTGLDGVDGSSHPAQTQAQPLSRQVRGCDSMVASYLIDASRSSHGLDALSLALLGRSNISLSTLLGKGKEMRTFDTLDLEQAVEYAAEDADVALQLRNIMAPQLHAMGMESLANDVEMPLVEALAEMEYNGITVNPTELDSQRQRLVGKIEELLKAIHAESKERLGRTFDPDSPKQLAAALFNKPDDEPSGLGIKGLKKTKTGFSTDAEVLEELAEDESISSAVPRLILEYRQLSKLVSTYLVALKEAIHPKTGRIHTSFNQTVAATGRLASSDPNLQNIPIRTDVGREIRRAFEAAPGHVLITADYSQIELRLLAHLSNDPNLIDAFRHDADIHTAVAAQIHGISPEQVSREQRSGAKMVNFGIVYGITPFGLARRLKIDRDKAAAIIDDYKRRFSGITTFLQECIEGARQRGYVETMLKRRRPIPDAHSNVPARRALAERLAINSVVQGSAADLIKVAMVRIHNEIIRSQKNPSSPLNQTKMLLQVHDELVFETPEEKAPNAMSSIVGFMEGAFKLLVPLKVDSHASKTWYDGK